MHLKALLREKENRLIEKMKSSKADFNGVHKHPSKWAGFLKPTGYKPMIILFFLFLIQQFSGIYITLFFAVSFLQDIDSEVNAFTASIFVGVVRFLMSLLNAWLLKRFKRRRLIMVSTSCMALCMFASGACTVWVKQGAKELVLFPVILLLLYVCSSMIGLLTIPWTMTAELFPNEIRGMAHSIAFSMANVLMFLAVQSYR
jgi:MFS family permease